MEPKHKLGSHLYERERVSEASLTRMSWSQKAKRKECLGQFSELS